MLSDGPPREPALVQPGTQVHLSVSKFLPINPKPEQKMVNGLSGLMPSFVMELRFLAPPTSKSAKIQQLKRCKPARREKRYVIVMSALLTKIAIRSR